MNRMGTLYGVGVGPGDPELLTLKALRVLRSVPVICYPACRPDAGSYALRIVQDRLQEGQELKGLHFPMARGSDRLLPFWRRSVEGVHEELAKGRDVAFITEGDPFFYSTFVYLLEGMTSLHPEVPVEVIPGVSSVMASSARTARPLAMADEHLAVLPAACEEIFLREALSRFDTVVLLKVSGVLSRIIRLLEDMGLLDQAVFVERCGRPEERVVRDLKTLEEAKVNYLSQIIVRKSPLSKNGERRR
ncbi:MAG: precorrin-2 C(20)-methyltransferase [Nitrospirae bacterium]|nr:precorrin-2 C(20)-methyltransferase [Nitrospirota bacterium]